MAGKYNQRQHASGRLTIIVTLLLSILAHAKSSLHHVYSDEDWERVLQNRKFLTQQGRNENAAKVWQQQDGHRGLQSNGPHSAVARTWNVLVCLMNWSNHGNRNKLPKADVEKLFMGTGRDAELHPGGSINDYFKHMSQGQFMLNAHVADWVKTSKSESTYTADGSQGRSQEIQEAFKPVMQALDKSNFDFSKYDSDGDNEIDLTVFLHSGYDGVYPGDDCDTGLAPNERIASHYRLRSSESDWLSKSGHKLGTYVVAPAYYGNCDFEINGIGVIVHEIIHAFGIPDLYDTSEFSSTGFLGGIDYYGIMANPWNPGFDSRFPGPVMGWTKMELGWVTPTEIESDGVYTIRAAETSSDVYVIRKGYADGEYLLIENRQAIEGGFDEKFFSPGGITIYHIDEGVWSLFPSQGSKGNTPKGGPFQDDWPQNGMHYPVALLQADGLYELEQNINGGDSGDMYGSPDQVLGPGNGEQIAKDANYPNTDSYAWGTTTVTGITIKNFQYTDETTMSFEVTGLGAGPEISPTAPPETSSPTAKLTESPTVKLTESPTVKLTESPTMKLTESPTKQLVEAPTPVPETSGPTLSPTQSVPATLAPTDEPQSPPPSTDPATTAPTDETKTPPPADSSTEEQKTFAPVSSETTVAPTVAEDQGVFAGTGCDEAIPASTNGTVMQGSTGEGSQSVDTPFCGANITGPGQWFTFNGTGNPIEIAACGVEDESSTFGVAVSVFSGKSCEALSCVSGTTFSNQACSTTERGVRSRFLQSSIPFSVTADDGVPYYLLVHGQNSSSPGNAGVGSFELFVKEGSVLSETQEDLPKGKGVVNNVTSNTALSLEFEDFVSVLTEPTNGTVSSEDNTTLIYVSDKNFTGTDQFDIQRCDDEDNCTRLTVTVEVTEGNETITNKEESEGAESEEVSSESSKKNVLYSLLVLLLLIPLLWIFRTRICCCCSMGKNDNPSGKSSRNLVEEPFQDEEDNNGYTDDDAEDLAESDDDDADSDGDEVEEEETNESQYDPTCSTVALQRRQHHVPLCLTSSNISHDDTHGQSTAVVR